MEGLSQEIDDLIVKILTDEASEHDKLELDHWLKASSENHRYYDDVKRVWLASATALPNEYTHLASVDTDMAWLQVKKRIHTPKPLTVRWLSMSNILKIAAAVLILITASLFFIQKNKPIEQHYVAESVVKTETLTDGSVITLNKKSSLSTVFSKKERRVKMSGEAYFAIAHDKQKPFIIEVKNVEVKVVGTAFNVDNLSQPNFVIIVIEEGIVEVKGGKEILRLTKGQKATYNVSNNTFTMSEQADKNTTAYKTGKLDFDHQTLKQVVADINRLFGHHIEIASPSIENCQITTVYEGQDLEFFFKEIIGESIKIELTKQGNMLILRGQGCE